MAAREFESVAALTQALRAAGVTRLSTHSAACNARTAFLAYPGYARDTRPYIEDAFKHGAPLAIALAEGSEAFDLDERSYLLADLKAAASQIAGELLDHPSRAEVHVTAVTGTNGKTSTALWFARLSELLGTPCGVIGTLGVGQPGALQSTGLTTPDPVVLQNSLADFAKRRVYAVAMEASSHGIAEGRMNALQVRTAIFTNLTQDHLDFHGTMQEYAAVKARLFSWPGLEHAVVNADDAFGQELLLRSPVPTLSFSVGGPADLSADEPIWTERGMRTAFTWRGKVSAQLELPMVGRYNLENICAVLGAALAQGRELGELLSLLPRIGSVPGRMHLIGGEGVPLVVVDYAHTPDALTKALTAVRPLAEKRGGKVCVVFGCGGDRDPTKRPLMGKAAAAGADRVMITSDNPRTESPSAIIEAILAAPTLASGVVEIELDRAAAINQSLRIAGVADVVLIAGKGHEDYQIIGAQKRHFDDAEVARAALASHWGAHV